MHDVVVIGGGASGLAAAIAAARAGADVLVLERDVACGLPILATGNGRCNLSNEDLDTARYLHPDAARAVMGAEPERALAGFFGSLGIMTCSVEGRLYPVTRRAESVRDALLSAAHRAGARLRCGCEIIAARCADGCWHLRVREPERPVRARHDAAGKLDLRRARRALGSSQLVEREIEARSVVLAVGGSSERLCGMFGVPHRAEVPVLCPVAREVDGWGPDPLRRLDGLRAEAAVSLLRGGRQVYREEGEVLFRPYGISGIVAFDLSRRVRVGDRLELDLFPGYDASELLGRLRAREDAIGPFDGVEASWFDGVLARPLARLVLELAAADPSGVSDGLRGDVLTRCARLCRALPFEVTGLAEQRQAQVRRGGVPWSAVDAETLAVHGTPCLHVCGEALDQDAGCGGFNLAWAWLTGIRAGESAARCA